MNIAIFVFAYPVLSETFVINELFQLQEIGVHGEIWREKTGTGNVHPKTQKLKFKINDFPEKIFGANFEKILRSHIWWFLREPLRYLELLSKVFSSFPDLESIKIFIKAVVSAREVHDAKSHVVYVHESDRAFVFGLCAAHLNRLPLVLIFHTYYLFVKPRYISPKVKLATEVIFQSEYSKHFVSQIVGSSEKMTVVSLPGIDTMFFSPPKTQRKFSSKKIKIVSVGRLEEAKGFSFLIEAVALLKNKGLDVECTIIGDGSLKNELQQLVKKRKLQHQVSLAGSIPHDTRLQSALRAADYFVLPSIQDSEGVHDVHPNAVKEAMSAGLLVMTTQLGGIDEVIDDGVDGFLVDRAEPKLIAEKIVSIAEKTPKQKLQVSNAARQKILKQFEASQLTTQLRMIFEHYANKSS